MPVATLSRKIRKIERLGVENLESRLNLSAAAPLSAAPSADNNLAALLHGQQVSTMKVSQNNAVTALASLTSLPASITSQAPAGPTSMSTWYSYYMQLFGPKPAPTPTPTPTPTPNPTPNPAPPNNNFTSNPITIATTAYTGFNQLTITGTSGNDSIVVSQSGSTITIVANGQTYTQQGSFAQISITAAAGNDYISINSSVNLETLIYTGAGTDTVLAKANAKQSLVAIGGGTDTLTGNGINTSFWADTADVVNASSAETSTGKVHNVSAFYQPFSSNNSNPDYISLELNGQNIKDPTDSGNTVKLTGRSFWGTGPTMNDIKQGNVGDCYFLSTLAALANQSPDKLREMAVDLGDGTYAVQFKRNGNTSYVRLDADVPTYGGNSLVYNKLTNSNNIWAIIMEKAYAYYRKGQNTYASLSSGWMGTVMSDLGVANKMLYTSDSGFYNTVVSSLAAGKAVTVATNSTVSNAPVIGYHAYTVVSAQNNNGVITYTLRNPWGVDGAGNDGNTNDALVTLTAAQLKANFSYGSAAT
jgi:hypothetical protein